MKTSLTPRRPQGAPPVPTWQSQARALLQQGRLHEAEAVLTGVILEDRRNPAALHLMGLAARDGGKLVRAVSLLKQAVELDGRCAAYVMDLGYVYLVGGRHEEAATCYQQALTIDPDGHLAEFGLGMALSGQRAFSAAAGLFSRYVAAAPADPEGHLQLSTSLMEAGHCDQALAAIGQVFERRANHAPDHLQLGRVLLRLGERPRAREQILRAVALDPVLHAARLELEQIDREPDEAARAEIAEGLRPLSPEMMPALYAMAEEAILLGRFEEAGWCYQRALSLHADIPAPYQGLAQVSFIEGNMADSRRYALMAAERGAEPAAVQAMLGQVYEAEGDFPAAIAAFEQAVALRPTEVQSHLRLAMLRKPVDAATHLQELQQLGSLPGLQPAQQATLGFALGRSYDQMGDYDAAFAHFKTGNDIRRSLVQPYEENKAVVDAILSVFTPAFLQDRRAMGDPSHRPVFVLGMMRSGTTLMEQILATHPQVYGHSELTDMRRIAAAMPAAAGGTLSYPNCVPLLDESAIRHFAQAYLTKLERQAPGIARSVDKMPQNFQHIGIIALLFPNARILHCTRDPVDTCLSNYFHDYGAPNSYTYDLGWLGSYYRQYQRLMDHWQATVPDMILTVPYEGMVVDQEGWSRRAIDFIGLDWDDACLAFHSNTRSVNTFSVWQVRQPIYTTAIKRWGRYRKHLEPLFAALGVTPD